ncbi:NADH dehydrogenase [ubiquinone] 1 alpha subcomplex subunit 1 [Triticum aestivum]|uniref:NADH dehydrogenase [ubiquinone] 1 alpha subcomplex subunit 1 n=1 Tax=Triticum aestivum TaxID=4565 RepID=UPI001D024A81|nr:NADH dehydrogenase [ubiquinone] 1 alpha subcomplex subunit 1-like [Triticum aestivum]
MDRLLVEQPNLLVVAVPARPDPSAVRRLPVRLPMARFRLHWLEAMLPLGIIGGFLCIMGNGQYYIHRAAHGRPKHIGNDMWDVAMERRDKKLVDKPAAN